LEVKLYQFKLSLLNGLINKYVLSLVDKKFLSVRCRRIMFWGLIYFSQVPNVIQVIVCFIGWWFTWPNSEESRSYSGTHLGKD